MAFVTQKKEILFAAGILCSALLLVNSTLFYGLNLGAAIGLCLCVLCSFGYLLSQRRKPSAYAVTLLVLSLGIGVSFARADDSVVKFFLAVLTALCVNLSFCLQAGKNKYGIGTAASLLDGVTTFFRLGFGEMAPSCRGLIDSFRNSTGFGKKGASVLLGLCIALPLMIILVPLLMSADAAFEGLMDMLPSFSLRELLATLLAGVFVAFLFYTRTVALHQKEQLPSAPGIRKGLPSLTVNTVLVAICLVYCVYLVSQLAYFSGGFSGILPEEYTLAEYARRGFFEMAWLCALNLCIIIGALWVCDKKDPAPLLTRILCLFLGIVTLFLIATASAKMLMYIDSYGLTRLRVLTQTIMVFMGIVTLFVCLWLFVRKLPYMKFILIAGLLIGAILSWADVDTVVARYNTEAYLSGKMETVDVAHLNSLGDGAVPYLVQLHKEARDETVREMARDVLISRSRDTDSDFRGWNYASAAAEDLLQPYREMAVEEAKTDIKSRPLSMD